MPSRVNPTQHSSNATTVLLTEITALVEKGYLIRARTDSDTKEARTDSTARRDEMMASGAQMLSTDYPVNEPARWTGHYVVALPGNSDGEVESR